MNATRIGKKHTKQVTEIPGYRSTVQKVPTNQRRSMDVKEMNLYELEFSVLKHLSNNHFTSEPIDETNIKAFYDDVSKLLEYLRAINYKHTVEIDALIKNRARLNHYQSEVFDRYNVNYIKSKTFFKKWLEQRIRNMSEEKMQDNFRYFILRSDGLANTNQFPFGVDINDTQTTMDAFDRSNLTEFEVLNCYRYLNKTDLNVSPEDYGKLTSTLSVDTLSKRAVTDVVNHIMHEYPRTYPVHLDNFLDRIKNDSASARYQITDILTEDQIANVLERYNACRILIGHREVISKELENLNNKNNPWNPINFLFQNINSKTKLMFVDEAKSALERDDYGDCMHYHSGLKDIAPEYVLLPVIAEDIFNMSDFKTNNNERFENFTNLANLLEGVKFHSKGDTWVFNKYQNLTKIPEYKYKLVNDFYTFEALEIWKRFDKKLIDLKKVLQKLIKRNDTSHNQHHEFTDITPSSIDGLRSPKFAYNTYANLALLFAGNGKTIKNSRENVINAVELFLKKFFGDEVFTVDLVKNKYTIKDSNFFDLLKDKEKGGYSTSHMGRAEYFATEKLQEYKQSYQEFEAYQGTNDELVDKQIRVINDVLGVNRFGWYEDTTHGDAVFCGWDGDNRTDTSWEHIDNTTQSVGAIRNVQTNSAEGAKTKAFKTTSEYYEYILKQQDVQKVKDKYDDENERLLTSLHLKKIIAHFKKEESN